MRAICFIEKKGHQRREVSGDEVLYVSGDWKVAEKVARELVGRRIYFHRAQSEPSYLGGWIRSYRVLPSGHPCAGRIEFVFSPDPDGVGFEAGREGWRRERKTVIDPHGAHFERVERRRHPRTTPSLVLRDGLAGALHAG